MITYLLLSHHNKTEIKVDMKTKKILVKIWVPLLNKVNVMAKDACLKRDSYLNNVLSYEAKMLGKEVRKANSEQAKKYLSSKLLALKNFKSVNLLLEEKTIEIINNVCSEKNIPRDSFINRVLLLLTANWDTLESLFEGYGDSIPEVIGENDEQHYFPYRASVLDTIAEFTETDPFWLLRGCLREIKKYESDKSDKLHSIFFNQISDKTDESIDYENIPLQGFNCFVSDEMLSVFDLFKEPSFDLNERKESRKQEAKRFKEKLQNKGGN